MAELKPFVPPSWLSGHDAESIHKRMMDELPDGIDDTEAGFPWDFTKPTALEIARLVEFNMMETVKIMHYMFSYGIYLDYHAQSYGLERRPAAPASGVLTITGSPSTIIPEGFLFAVPASGDSAAITFYATEDVMIDHDGNAEVHVAASVPGVSGNVAANTIVIMASPSLSGIECITNKKELTGGSQEEDDETLRQRIKDFLESSDASFVGCDSDYTRWAKEVAGVGNVVVDPEFNGAGTVRVIVFDLNGEPANDYIVNAVNEHIVSPNDRSKRLAPIGATVTVMTPTIVEVPISCNLTLSVGADYTETVESIKQSIAAYFKSAHGEIKRNTVGSIIIGTTGVDDYTDLKLNGVAANFEFENYEYPVIKSFSTESGE